MSKKILISTTTFAEFDKTPLDLIEGKGFSYILNPCKRKMKSEEIVDFGKDISGIIAGTEQLNEDVFSQLPKLKVVSRCGSGMDNVDIEFAKKRGIEVFNTPDGPTKAVAELAIGLILNLLRKVGQADRIIRSGNWEKKMGNLLYGKKVAIVGFGRIGQQVAELVSAFGVEIAYCDVEDKNTKVDCTRKTLEEILAWADIVTLHLAPSSGGEALIAKRELDIIRTGSWIINLSRGGVVDEKALYDALKEDRLAGAALDVFGKEPYDGPFSELDNVVLTPHIGSYAVEARIKMEIDAAKNLLAGLEKA